LAVEETSKPMNDPKHALLARAASLVEKTAAPMLWKYTDEDGKDFYLTEKRTGTVKSPYSGKSFTPKPTRSSLSDVGKELKQDDAKVKGSLWKYVDGEGKEFYLPERLTGTLKSPYSGKSFTPKAEKSTLSDVGKELKQDAKAEKKAADEDPEQGQQGQDKTAALADSDKKVVDAFYEKKPAEGKMLTTDGKVLEKIGLGGKGFAKWEGGKIVVDASRPQVKNDEEILRYMKKSIPAGTLAPHSFFGNSKKATSEEQWELASEIIKQGEKHPALAVIKKQYDAILEGVKTAAKRSAAMKRIGVGRTEDPNFVLIEIRPEIEKLSKVSEAVAAQLTQRLTGSGKW